LWLHSLKVVQLLRSAACLHTNQSRSYLNHLVHAKDINPLSEQKVEFGILNVVLHNHWSIRI